METAQEDKVDLTQVRTPELDANHHVGQVKRSLDDYGIPATVEDITPQTPETQVKSEEVKTLGGTLTGEDIMHDLGLGEEGQTTRYVSSAAANAVLEERLKKEAAVGSNNSK